MLSFPASTQPFATRSIKRYALTLLLVFLPIAPPVPKLHFSFDTIWKNEGGREPVWTAVPSLYAEPSHDATLTILALGDWKGNLGPDERGRGGMASLYTLVDRSRKRARFQGGDTLLFYSGDLTGEENPSGFLSKILSPGMNLIRYMGFSGLSLSARENAFLASIKKREIHRLPFLSFDALPVPAQTNGKTEDPAVHPYRILTGEGWGLLATGLTGGKEPLYDTDPEKRLGQELQRQTGVDLFLLMSKPPVPRDDAGSGSSSSPYAERERYLFLYDPDTQDPLAIENTESTASRTILIESGANQNLFFRLPSGAAVCRIQGRSLCEIRVTIRNHRIISMRQRFLSVNGADEASEWIPPDRNLQRFLQK